MTDPLADPFNVQTALLRPLTSDEVQFVADLIEQASALLRNAAPSIDARIARYDADPTDKAGISRMAVTAVVAGIVKRYISNPRGLASTTDGVGPYSHSESYALRSEKETRGALQVTSDDLATLFPTRKRLRAGTIRTRPALAPRPVGRYGPLPTVASAIDAQITYSAGNPALLTQEASVSFSPLAADVTKISGAPIVIASSATSVALTFGRQHLVTGSAAQPVTVATPTVDGTIVSIKVADGSTATVTLPSSLQVSGVTGMTAGQDFDWFWSAASSTWSIE